MEIQEIFGLLKRLTMKTHVNDLINELTEIIIENFSGVRLIIYELQLVRSEHSKSPHIVCMDCLGFEESIDLNSDKGLKDAYTKAQEIKISHGLKQTELIFPVVLYDNSISHLISVKHGYPEGNGSKLLTGLLQVFTDIFRSLHEKGYDPLTRILNRQAFDQVASNLTFYNKQNITTDNTFKAIAILDIDNFKRINDNFGHTKGDETLALFAQTIRSVLRQEELFFRYGGEEFVVLVKEAGPEQAFAALERCRTAIESTCFPEIGPMTVSIGYVELTPDSHLIDELSKADKALYYIKNHGRNQVKSYDKLMREHLL